MKLRYRPTTNDGYRRYFAMTSGLCVPLNYPISWLADRDLLDIPVIAAWEPHELAGARGWHPRGPTAWPAMGPRVPQ